jgi:hypothetical protein
VCSAGGRHGCLATRYHTALNVRVACPTHPPTPPSPHESRSRVVSVKDPERSYHIFYQLCAGASEEQAAELV